jgi:nitrate/nitrite-specific signal transduction histidine kinase
VDVLERRMEQVLESCAEHERDSARRLLSDIIGELRFSTYQLDGQKNDLGCPEPAPRPVAVSERTATLLFEAVGRVVFAEPVAAQDGVRLLTLLHRRTVSAAAAAAARELHDEVAGRLAVALNCFELYDLHRTQRPRTAQERLAGARESVRDSLTALRSLMARLRRQAVDPGAPGAVRPLGAALLRDLGEPGGCPGVAEGGVRVRVEVSGDELLSERTARELFLIVREAQRNAVRHAKASQVTVSVEVLPERVEARIEDDGCGFAPDAAPYGCGGLLSMRERAALLGGSLAVESGAGTRVLVRVPLRGGMRAARR